VSLSFKSCYEEEGRLLQDKREENLPACEAIDFQHQIARSTD
jgi:hypothetical protein